MTVMTVITVGAMLLAPQPQDHSHKIHGGTGVGLSWCHGVNARSHLPQEAVSRGPGRARVAQYRGSEVGVGVQGPGPAAPAPPPPPTHTCHPSHRESFTSLINHLQHKLWWESPPRFHEIPSRIR